MTKADMRHLPIGRRNFVKLVGVAGTVMGVAPVVSAPGFAPSAEAATPSRKPAYWFLNDEEVPLVKAAIDTFIPHDEVGPGALELDVALYIDRQLASGYGKGDRLYIDGPFATGTPQQGYQLALTPAQVIRNGLSDLGAHVLARHHNRFELLPMADRVAVLQDLEAGKIDLRSVPAATFFGILLQLTVEGYFADPMYGGNRNAAAWRMIGFPGADAMYMDKIEPYRNKRYVIEPKGIADLI